MKGFSEWDLKSFPFSSLRGAFPGYKFKHIVFGCGDKMDVLMISFNSHGFRGRREKSENRFKGNQYLLFAKHFD